MNFKKINKEFYSLEYLGFVEKEFFEIPENIRALSFDDIFEHLMQSDDFWEKDVTKCKACFNDEIEKDDFEKISFLELKSKINEIKKEEDWGVDLLVFNKLTDNTFSWIEKNNYQNNSFLFIYSEDLDDGKLVELNFFQYYILRDEN
jgi:hypothetical protein